MVVSCEGIQRRQLSTANDSIGMALLWYQCDPGFQGPVGKKPKPGPMRQITATMWIVSLVFHRFVPRIRVWLLAGNVGGWAGSVVKVDQKAGNLESVAGVESGKAHRGRLVFYPILPPNEDH